MTLKLNELQNKTLSLLEKRLEELPVLPFVISKIASTDPSSADFVGHIEELSRLDPPFGLRLVRLANSVGASAHQPIVGLPAALSRIGARQLADAVTAMAVAKVFVPKTAGQKNLWTHSIQVAMAARSLAVAGFDHKIEAETAYLAGLLHDIGRFVLYHESIDQLGRIDEFSPSTAEALIAAEKQICGFTHAQLGWHACRQWGLPHLIEIYVKEHHNYEQISGEASNSDLVRLVRLLQLADRISFALLTEPGISRQPDAQIEKTLLLKCGSALKWSPQTTPAHLRNIAKEVQQETDRLVKALGFFF